MDYYNGTYTPSQRYFLTTTNNWYNSAESTVIEASFKVTFNVNIIEEATLFKINLEYPTKAYEYIDWLSSNIALAPELIKDVEAKYEQFKQPSLDRTYKLKGEVNSKYPSDAIYANFTRSLEKDLSSRPNEDGIEKWGHFKMYFHDHEILISVSVAPYRNGSKAKYFASIPYKVTDKNSINMIFLDELSSKIKSIINS